MSMQVRLHPLIDIVATIYFRNVSATANVTESILSTWYDRRSKSQFNDFSDLESLCSSYPFKSSFMYVVSKECIAKDAVAASGSL